MVTRRADRGLRRPAFTLVEVLAALVLVGIVLPVAMRGISLATAAASHTARQAKAAALADTKLAEVLLTDAWQDGASEGDFGRDQPDYRWRLDVREWLETQFKEIEVRVEWTEHGADRFVSLTTAVYTGSE